ncbi:hypothetical protein ASG69_07400 [Rhodococcus sp. Leaf225]|nr:hypothetical protein ASG69_07400 [Rhodococcus sp. Leaf225]KQU41056.1 hypothetical protein ASH03_18960 [Rhodococcus sp. Leaf258]
MLVHPRMPGALVGTVVARGRTGDQRGACRLGPGTAPRDDPGGRGTQVGAVLIESNARPESRDGILGEAGVGTDGARRRTVETRLHTGRHQCTITIEGMGGQ